MANPNGNPQNLVPWQPGQSGNPDGNARGLRQWSTLVQSLLEEEDFADKLIAKKPGWWDELPQKNAGFAIVATMIIQAMGGDVKAATWLRKTGFGDKLDLTNSDRNLKPVYIFDMRSGEEMVTVPKSKLIEGELAIEKLKPKPPKSKGKAKAKKPVAKPAKKSTPKKAK